MPQDSKTPGEALPEEIRELERLLEEKKQALAEKGEEREGRDIFRDVFLEKYPPPEVSKLTPPPSVIQPPTTTRPKGEDELRKKEREEEIASLIEISFEKGVRHAVDLAQRASPWLLDELHDRLIDEYYQKLEQAKLIS